MKIVELYNQKQYAKVLDEYLQKALQQSYSCKDRNLGNKLDDLKIILFSCCQCGAYAEMLELLEKIYKCHIQLKLRVPLVYIELKFLALLYYFFNKEEYRGNISKLQSDIDNVVVCLKEKYNNEKTSISELTGI